MSETYKKDQSKLMLKYHQFELRGLRSYLKYLEKEFAAASKSSNKIKYTKYIEKEIVRAKAKIEKLEIKLS